MSEFNAAQAQHQIPASHEATVYAVELSAFKTPAKFFLPEMRIPIEAELIRFGSRTVPGGDVNGTVTWSLPVVGASVPFRFIRHFAGLDLDVRPLRLGWYFLGAPYGGLPASLHVADRNGWLQLSDNAAGNVSEVIVRSHGTVQLSGGIGYRYLTFGSVHTIPKDGWSPSPGSPPAVDALAVFALQYGGPQAFIAASIPVSPE